MDPRVEFGRPVLKVSAVPTAVIADRYKAGESIADLADDYGEDPLNYNQLEKQAVIAVRLRFFSIASSSLTGEEAASLILSALNKMARLCRQHSKRGFIAKISRGREPVEWPALDAQRFDDDASHFESEC
jgi:uncharacterized protein (DUF433 family)